MIDSPNKIMGKGCLSQTATRATFGLPFWPAEQLPFSDAAAASASLGGIRKVLDQDK